MRARAGVVAIVLAISSGCTDGGGSGGVSPTTVPTVTSIAPSTVAPTTVVPATTTTTPTGSVTLRVTAFTLPELRSGGSGLRLVVGVASPRLTVSRRGGGGAVSACPVTGATAAVAPGDCLDLGVDGSVGLSPSGVAGASGVELRATGPDARVEEVSVTYVPASRATTVVTPSRPAGACAARPCEASFSLLPARPGPFVLDGTGGGGRPRLVLTAVPVAGGTGSNRTLASAEGGGSLSIRATLDADSAANLLHHQQGPGAVAVVTAEILWP